MTEDNLDALLEEMEELPRGSGILGRFKEDMLALKNEEDPAIYLQKAIKNLGWYKSILPLFARDMLEADRWGYEIRIEMYKFTRKCWEYCEDKLKEIKEFT